MNVLKFPARFSAGSFLKVNTDSDEGMAQIVAGVIQTRKGELPVAPEYGTDSPEFNELDVSGLLYTLSEYHPSIEIDSIDQEVDNFGNVVVLVNFSGETS